MCTVYNRWDDVDIDDNVNIDDRDNKNNNRGGRRKDDMEEETEMAEEVMVDQVQW